ncbi:MAG: DoxX family protein [Acidiferrobacteraceae bacterium]
MNNAVPILIRIFLVVLFPFSALDKIFDWKDALRQANSSFLPGGPVLLVSGILIEFIAPMCIVLAWHDRLAALVLAGFCAVTAILYHNFWTFSGPEVVSRAVLKWLSHAYIDTAPSILESLAERHQRVLQR